MTPSFEESAWNTACMASNVLHEQFHRNKPQTEVELISHMQTAMLNCFRAGAIWRDTYLESRIEFSD